MASNVAANAARNDFALIRFWGGPSHSLKRMSESRRGCVRAGILSLNAQDRTLTAEVVKCGKILRNRWGKRIVATVKYEFT